MSENRYAVKVIIQWSDNTESSYEDGVVIGTDPSLGEQASIDLIGINADEEEVLEIIQDISKAINQASHGCSNCSGDCKCSH